MQSLTRALSLACCFTACGRPDAVVPASVPHPPPVETHTETPPANPTTPPTPSPALPGRTALDTFITTRLALGHFPGIAVGVVKNNALVWAQGYGLANVDTHTPVTPDTIFQMASVSKTVDSIAIMELVEHGALQLDAPVAQHLPFPLAHPSGTTQPITLRMLLTHTSGIRDDGDYLFHDVYVQGDSPQPLGDFLQSYLSPGGAHFSRENNYDTGEPGTTSEYSNVGVDLAAYVAERAAGVPFDQYCDAHVFAPLGLTATSFRLTHLDPTRLAMPYERDATAPQGFRALGHYGYPDYPDGLLHTSVRELSRVLALFMNHGALGDVRLLQPATVDAMMRVQDPELDETQGLIWYWKSWEGVASMGHNGSEQGVATEMFFEPSRNLGVIVLANAEDDNDLLEQIVDFTFGTAAAW